jgi:class 3 adenylate cyclase/tetratricopeptide (TPR) repeat protein
MQCPRCHIENPVDARFCEDCGARLTLTCPQCGAEASPGKRFCRSCGTTLPGDSAGPGPAPATYIPKHLIDKILTSRAALEGERKQVTVLFADMKGSMELLADLDPEEARKILDPVLELMMEAVHHYEGTVNQVMGDGVMALFGAPLAHEDHAARACYAALRMQEATRRYTQDVRRSHGAEVQIRVGLNSGEVVVRSLGSDLRMDYTAVGQTTHVAARMEQLATPGTIRLAADTLRLVEGIVDVTSLGPVPVKGLTAPVDVFELVGATPGRRRFETVAARGLTRFVGRQTELAVLTDALERAKAGRGQIVAPVGEPGVGKSRLFWEFTHSRRPEGCLILQAGAVSYGKATAYLPVVELLKGYFHIQDRDDHREIREKVIGRLLTLDRRLEPSVPAFLALLDVPVDESAWEHLDPLQRRQQVLEGVKRLILRESQVQPVILVVEDLHWIDSETQALLDALVGSLPSTRILLLVNYRPEYQHTWGGRTYYTQLHLDPLPPESAADLLNALLGDHVSVDELKRLLIDRTEGNPFFLEETVRTLVESRALAGDRGMYRLTGPLDTVQVPVTVQAVLAARLDRLPGEDKTLLQTAAVIGKEVPYALLRAVAELPEETLRSRLEHLRAAEFLYEAVLFPELELTFKHALTHEVAYGSLLHDRRRALHGRILGAIEEVYRDRLAEHTERLGHHAFRAGRWQTASRFLRQAGARALDRSANAEAAAVLEQALTALEHLPPSRERAEEGLDLRLELRNALWLIGRLDRLFEVLREAEPLAVTLGDQHRLGRVVASMASLFCLTGDPDRAIEAAHRTLAIATSVEDFPIRAATTSVLGWTQVTMGDYRRAADIYKENIASLEGQPAREPFGLTAVSSRAFLAWSLAELGEFAEARDRAEEAVRMAEDLGRPFPALQASFGLGFVHLRRGEFRQAISVLERGLGVCRASGLRALAFHGIAAFLGAAYSLSGRSRDAIALLEPVVAQAAAMGANFDYLITLLPLGEAQMLDGRLDEADRLATRAVEVARAHKERGHEAWAYRLLGEISARREPAAVEPGSSRYREALALADELGMRPLGAHCHLGLGKLYHRTGQRQEAQEHLTTATMMYRQMDMRFWLEQAETELRGLT